MTRIECEKAIIEKLEEVRAIAREYCGKDCDLSIFVFKDGYVGINNKYWLDDYKVPLAAYVGEDGEFVSRSMKYRDLDCDD